MPEPLELELKEAAAPDDDAAMEAAMQNLDDDGNLQKGSKEPEPEREEPAVKAEPEPPEAVGSAQSEKEGEGSGKPAEAPTTQPDEPEDEFEKDLNENPEHELPRNASENSKRVNKLLKGKATAEHRGRKAAEREAARVKSEMEELQREYEETKKAIPPPDEIDNLRKTVRELAIERDPEFNRKYAAPIKQHEEAAVGAVKEYLSESVLAYIDKSGGLLKFRDSLVPMPKGTTDTKGDPFDGTQSEYWDEVIEKALPPSVRRAIRYNIDKAETTAIERDQELARAKADPDSFLKKREAEQAQISADYTKSVNNELIRIRDEMGEVAKPKQIPADATPEAKKEIEARNAMLSQAEKMVVQALTDNSPKVRAGSAVAYAWMPTAQIAMDKKDKENEVLTKENAELKEKLEKIKAGGQTTRKQGIVQHTEPKKPVTVEDDDEAAVEASFKDLDDAGNIIK